MEHPSYRLCIENLNALYPSCETFTLKQACAVLGMSDKTVKAHYIPQGHMISKVNLALILARMGGNANVRN